jgi:hypothetical protein
LLRDIQPEQLIKLPSTLDRLSESELATYFGIDKQVH